MASGRTIAHRPTNTGIRPYRGRGAVCRPERTQQRRNRQDQPEAEQPVGKFIAIQQTGDQPDRRHDAVAKRARLQYGDKRRIPSNVIRFTLLCGTVGVKLYCRYRKFSGILLTWCRRYGRRRHPDPERCSRGRSASRQCRQRRSNVRMSLLNSGNAFRCADEIHQLDVLLRRGA